jgi:hypothetical protein
MSCPPIIYVIGDILGLKKVKGAMEFINQMAMVV